MPKYHFFKLGKILSTKFSIETSYRIADLLAIIYYTLSFPDRKIIKKNLEHILDTPSKKILKKHNRKVFSNFAKYLVDFFRQSMIDKDFIKNKVKLKGLNILEDVLKEGKGAIGLTAHIGNWEMAGVIMSVLGYKVNGVALSHKDKRINAMFLKQRTDKGMNIIPLGGAFSKCITHLKQNEIVGLLGDRDYSHHGMMIKFFERDVEIPTGPALLHLKSGAPIVPLFLIRNNDDTFTFFIEEPIKYIPTENTNQDCKDISKQFVIIIERYVKKYPDQFFMFQEFWKTV